MSEPNNQVAIIQNSIELFKTAPQVLRSNQERTEKAIVVGNNILGHWIAAWGIPNEDERLKALAAVDERSNKFMVNCNTALTQERELRAAITQMMDAFKQMFFDAESQIDPAKVNTVPSKIRNQRNTFAKEAKKISDRKIQEAADRAAKQKEAIDLKAEAAEKLFDKYNTFLHDKKTRLQNGFNAITMENFDEKEKGLNAYAPVLDPAQILGFQLAVFAKYHSTEEIKEFIQLATQEKLNEFTSNYAAELTMMRDELIDKLPSKKTELLQIKQMQDDIAEAQRKADLEKDQKAKEKAQADLKLKHETQAQAEKDKAERERKDAERLQNEAAESKTKNDQEAEIKKQGEKTMVMFEQQADIAEAGTQSVRQGYEITVLHQVGYTQIFALYFENEGKNLPLDKLGRTSLDQMKAWAEKKAQKDGTKIESKFLKYEESFRAVNRKQKAEA